MAIERNGGRPLRLKHTNVFYSLGKILGKTPTKSQMYNQSERPGSDLYYQKCR